MKKMIFLATLILSVAFGVEAEEVDSSKIGFKPVVVTEGLPYNVVSYLENQVLSVLNSKGLALSDGDFLFEISVNQISKKITPTAPPRTQLHLEIVVKAIDKRQNIVLNSTSMTAAGIDNSESAAYMTAARSATFNSRNFLNFIDVSKSRLLEYYSAHIEEPQQVEEPQPQPAPIVEELSVAQSPQGIELSQGVYAEYVKTETKSQSTNVILRLTNYNDNDETINLRGLAHTVVDESGRNIKSSYQKYQNGDYLPYSGFLLLKGVPVNVVIGYAGNIAPQVMFFNEAHRDVKVRIEMM